MSSLERRYVVLKWKDIEAAELLQSDLNALLSISNRVDQARANRGKAPLESVVVEKDWPEYDEVVSRILTRDRLT